MSLKYGSAIVEKLLRVIDGDTFAVNLNRFSPIAGKNISIRIRGYNAPELRTSDEVERLKAVRAKNDLTLLLTTAKEIKLYDIKRGKYWRLIADIYIDGKNIVPMLVAAQSMRLRVIAEKDIIPHGT